MNPKKFLKQGLFFLTERFLGLFPIYFQSALLPILCKNIGLNDLRVNYDFKLNDLNFNINFGLFDTDTSVFPYIIKNKGWETYEPESVYKLLKSNIKYDIYDIGANQGLFCVQLLKLIETSSSYGLVNVYLFEPDKRLYHLIDTNIKNNVGLENVKIKIIDKALSDKDGITTFYLEEGNCSNNSLDYRAMVNSTSKLISIDIECVASSRINEIAPSENKVIYKSDIQGKDLDVFTNLPKDFLDKIEILVIEIWPLLLKNEKSKIDFLKSYLTNFKDVRIYGQNNQVFSNNINEIDGLLNTTSNTKYYNIIASRT